MSSPQNFQDPDADLAFTASDLDRDDPSPPPSTPVPDTPPESNATAISGDSTGSNRIALERTRQIEAKRFTAQRDAEVGRTPQQLASYAIAFIEWAQGGDHMYFVPVGWTFADPDSAEDAYTKAGATLAAAIDLMITLAHPPTLDDGLK